MNTSEKIDMFMKKGILVSPELIDEVDESIVDQLATSNDLVVLDREKIEYLKKQKSQKEIKDVKVVYNYTKEAGKRNVQDFVKYFNHRYKAIEKILRKRSELDRLTSIQRVLAKTERERVSVIGMVNSKNETKNGNLILEIEDPSGRINIIVGKDKEIFKIAKNLVLDEVIGVNGGTGEKVLFVENIVFPDIPLGKEMKKGPEENYSIFISDIEVGSKQFLKNEFEKFIAWLRGEEGDEEYREMARKVKYLFIVGDLVAGVGVYPGQEDDLIIQDIKEQYAVFTDYIKQVPQDINIVICLGNHDAGRLAEPQLPLYEDFAEELYKMPNVISVSNPSILKIEETETFEGFDVLLYHGYSMPYFADNIESIRSSGGQKRPDMILEFYMKRRHLAPTHTSNLYIPDTEHDPMVVEKIPDFLATGHVHRTSVHNYRGITLMNCSTWVGESEDQIKRGLIPQPGRAMAVNLKSREVKVMNFYKTEENDEMQ